MKQKKTTAKIPEVLNDHGDRGHSVLGGSSAERWLNCPGSVFLLKDLPYEEAGEAAQKGTAAHEVCEKLLANFLEHKTDGTDLLDVKDLTDEEQTWEFAAHYVSDIWKEILEESLVGKDIFIEERLEVSTEFNMFGYADCSGIYIDDRGSRVGFIVDYKNGYGEVVADKNAQLAYYADGLLQMVRRFGKDLDYVVAAIIQPHSEPRFKKTKFTAKQLDTWHAKFIKAATQIYIEKKPKFKVGEWCGYCKAKGVCPKYAAVASQKTQVQLFNIKRAVLPDVESLSNENILKIVEHGDMLIDFVKSCKSMALARLQKGRAIPGLKAVKGKEGRRSFVDDEKLVIKTLRDAGVEACKKTLRGIVEVEKDLAKILGDEEATEVMATITERGSAPTLLVPESDPRPSITTAVDLLKTKRLPKK